jgi:hypothetical protein
VSFVNKLRKKPKHVRDNIAFGTSVGLTLVIAVVWFWHGGSTHLADSAATTDSGFFDTFKSGLKKQMASAKEAFPSSSGTTTPTSTNRGDLQSTPVLSATSTSPEQKPVMIEIVHASGTATSSSSTSPY